MAFSRRRGRPKKTYESGKDKGTIELQRKRNQNFTAEPLDLCLSKGLIDQQQHNAGLRFRWLYTLKLGAPTISAYLPDEPGGHVCKYSDNAWIEKRQAEYNKILKILDKNNARKIVMDICVFNQHPEFLYRKVAINSNNLTYYNELNLLIEGLNLIMKY